jgi:L-iditol 2-dehydrogenase
LPGEPLLHYNEPMKAVYLIEPEKIEIREMPMPAPAEGEVLVRIKAALTCGTDLKAFLRGHPMIPMPGLFGHEFSGVVEITGEGVTAFSAGDEIMSVHTAPCLSCPYCLKKKFNLCDNIMNTKILGSFAEYIIVPPHIVMQNMYRKPTGLTFEEAAWLEPLACVMNGMRSSGIAAGDTVLIMGAGPIGLLHLLIAKQKGARVIICGLEPERLKLAVALGANLAVLPSDLRNNIDKATAGLGVDCVFECTGQPFVWEQSVDYVRRGGSVILFGGCKQGSTVCYDTYRIHYDEITLKGVFHYTPADVKAAYGLLCDRSIGVSALISGRYKLEDIREPFERLSRGDGIKYAIIP